MTNKLIRKRPNRLLSGRNNYFALGDQMNRIESIPGTISNFLPQLDTSSITPRLPGKIEYIQGGIDSFTPKLDVASVSTLSAPSGASQVVNTSNIGSKIKNAVSSPIGSAVASAVGNIGGGLISGGMTSGAGSVLSGLSGIAGVLPGPWGAVASAGLGIAGGLANRMFGSKMNKENIARVEGNIARLSGIESDVSDYDTLASNIANTALGFDFSNSYIGKDGWFSNKAKKKARALRAQQELAEEYAQNVFMNNAENIGEQQAALLEQNYAAYGGPLFFADGGRIHIKPENRGKFTETKRRTGKTTEELTHSKNPLTRKRAIFAQNAKKWHHAFGGDLMTHGANFDTGITLINNGGRHENSPYEGVPMGVDQEGTPNLVEEGEVIFNDYVFSNRLKVPKAVRSKYKLGNKPITFADAALKMSKESEERPNDPISQNGLQSLLGELAYIQEGIREKKQAKNTYAYGGELGNIFGGEGDKPNILAYPGGSVAIANADTYGNWNNFRYNDTLLYDPNTRLYNSMYTSDDFKNWAKTDSAAQEFF